MTDCTIKVIPPLEEACLNVPLKAEAIANIPRNLPGLQYNEQLFNNFYKYTAADINAVWGLTVYNVNEPVATTVAAGVCIDVIDVRERPYKLLSWHPATVRNQGNREWLSPPLCFPVESVYEHIAGIASPTVPSNTILSGVITSVAGGGKPAPPVPPGPQPSSSSYSDVPEPPIPSSSSDAPVGVWYIHKKITSCMSCNMTITDITYEVNQVRPTESCTTTDDLAYIKDDWGASLYFTTQDAAEYYKAAYNLVDEHSGIDCTDTSKVWGVYCKWTSPLNWTCKEWSQRESHIYDKAEMQILLFGSVEDHKCYSGQQESQGTLYPVYSIYVLQTPEALSYAEASAYMLSNGCKGWVMMCTSDEGVLDPENPFGWTPTYDITGYEPVSLGEYECSASSSPMYRRMYYMPLVTPPSTLDISPGIMPRPEETDKPYPHWYKGTINGIPIDPPVYYQTFNQWYPYTSDALPPYAQCEANVKCRECTFLNRLIFETRYPVVGVETLNPLSCVEYYAIGTGPCPTFQGSYLQTHYYISTVSGVNLKIVSTSGSDVVSYVSGVYWQGVENPVLTCVTTPVSPTVKYYNYMQPQLEDNTHYVTREHLYSSSYDCNVVDLDRGYSLAQVLDTDPSRGNSSVGIDWWVKAKAVWVPTKYQLYQPDTSSSTLIKNCDCSKTDPINLPPPNCAPAQLAAVGFCRPQGDSAGGSKLTRILDKDVYFKTLGEATDYMTGFVPPVYGAGTACENAT